MIIPQFHQIHQNFNQSFVNNIPQTVKKEIARLNLEKKSTPGQSVAIAVASRGTHDLTEIVTVTIKYLKNKGLKPFIIPAMGSHGGGTASGQTKVLESLGISEKKLEFLLYQAWTLYHLE